MCAEPLPDGMRIHGGALGSTGDPDAIDAPVIDAHGDHRIAMSFVIAALRASGPITIRDCANVETSFPGFVELAATAGLRIQATRG
jgi:3-phosphoshikimate 1-carboxyvinyltransferase